MAHDELVVGGGGADVTARGAAAGATSDGELALVPIPEELLVSAAMMREEREREAAREVGPYVPGRVRWHDFETAWADWRALNRDRHLHPLSPVRAVHLGLPHKSTVANRVKMLVSTVMLAMAEERPLYVSWTRTDDPDSEYGHHLALDNLFELPADLNLSYSHTEVHGNDRYDRFDVLGFGDEEYVPQEPLHRMLCADWVDPEGEMGRTSWHEVPWRYGFFAPLVYHCPYAAHTWPRILPPDNLMAPLATALFTPVPRISSAVDLFASIHFRKYRIVALELAPQADEWQFHQMVKSINEHLEVEPLPTEGTVSGAPGGLLRLPRAKFFVIMHSEHVASKLLAKFGDRFQFLYWPRANFSAPTNDDELIETYLLAHVDRLYITPFSTNYLWTMHGMRAHVVRLDEADVRSGVKPVQLDAAPQPCMSMNGIKKAPCWRKDMGFVQTKYKCQRPYPVF